MSSATRLRNYGSATMNEPHPRGSGPRPQDAHARSKPRLGAHWKSLRYHEWRGELRHQASPPGSATMTGNGRVPPPSSATMSGRMSSATSLRHYGSATMSEDTSPGLRATTTRCTRKIEAPPRGPTPRAHDARLSSLRYHEWRGELRHHASPPRSATMSGDGRFAAKLRYHEWGG